jgi:DNA topoisomerase-1
MSRSLVIVESPSKAKTIKKYLGEGFDVTASVGHIKDLPKNDIGVDVDKGFKPRYVTIRGKNKVLKDIRDRAKAADVIYLGPDPDREGEAIAWHLAQEIKKAAKGKPIYRVMINEITKKGVKEAINNPRSINEDRFYSQQTRRILDRLVGYQISPLLWDKVRRGLSAGRVQSVAVRMIVDRESDIAAFEPEEYWHLDVHLEAEQEPTFWSRLSRIKGEKATLGDEASTNAVLAACKETPFVVSRVIRKERKRNPPAPFTTSKLQQAAAQRLRMTTKRTMQVAQQLYEGIELGEQGAVGLITYMRTDSTRLSDDAVKDCRDYIEKKYGSENLPSQARSYKTGKNAQDAHEAIRPTSVTNTPAMVASYLSREQHRLYKLIWERFVACQMESARYDQTSIEITNGDNLFRSSGSILTFPGYLAVYGEASGEDEDKTLPVVEEGDVLKCLEYKPQQRFTQPPPRFSEATLVKELEEEGIGRPSTYASIISTIQDKNYVDKENGRFKPTELGSVVTELLVESFPEILDSAFTAQMERDLDRIEEGEEDWGQILSQFYTPFKSTLDAAKEGMRNLKRESTPTDIDCPTCGSKMMIKWGKNGYFLACSNYPDCKTTQEFERDAEGNIKPVEKVVEVAGECDKCGADMIVKSGRYGRFLACSAYPDCKNTKPLALEAACPKCGGELYEKRSRRGKVFYGCSNYPDCDFAAWDKPLPVPCPVCDTSYMLEKKGGNVHCPVCQAQYGSRQEVEEELAREDRQPSKDQADAEAK